MLVNKFMKKNILLCVAGATPQIITETLFVLTQNQEPKVRIDEIRVITTLEGRNRILNSLLNKTTGKFFEFCRDFGTDPNSITLDETCISLLRTRDGRTLEDIRTPEENELAGDQICDIVRELCKDENTRIFASAAGGRKTMSIYLTLAMSLFGRAEDSLSHVLVNEGFEGNNFYYPPPTPQNITYFNPQTKITREVSTADARIYLAPIPFIRFRGIDVNLLNEKNNESYKQAVDKAQTALKLKESASYELHIDLKRNIVKVVETTSNLSAQVKLSLREIFAYALFAFYRKENWGENGFISLDEIGNDQLKIVCQTICLERGQKVGVEDFSFFPKSDFINNLRFETSKKIVYQKKCDRFKRIKKRDPREKEVRITRTEVEKYMVKHWREIVGRIAPKFDMVFPQNETFEKFYIKRKGEKGNYVFGLPIEAERIKFKN